MTTTMISNLPNDLVNEILIRVPLKSMRAVRLTCKKWNDLSKCQNFTKMHIGKALAASKEGESQMIVMMDYNSLYLTSIFINGDPSTEHKGKLTCLNEQVKISKFFHCEGLLLCILKDDSKVVVWNPYLGQTRWIEPRFSHRPHGIDRFSYALGYEYKKNKSCRSHKFLRFIDSYYCHEPENQFFWYEIYDFDSGLWTTLDVTPHWRIRFCNRGVSLKGNTYFCAAERNAEDDENHGVDDHIICFDFTSERFGQLLPLPFNAGYDDYVTLSCVREEKLAVLLQHIETNPYELDLWVTTKIETEEVSWSKFLRLEIEFDIYVPSIIEIFFIDEEKKVAIGLDDAIRQRVIVIGEAAGYFRAFDPVGDFGDQECRTDLCSYVPSLVQIKQSAGGDKKQPSDLEKRRYDEKMSRLVSLGANQ